MAIIMEPPAKVIKITYPNGVYVGQYIEADGVPKEQGFGLFTWQNGDVYEGDYENGHRSGKGRFIWADGKQYDGDFVEDRREGHGSLKWPDGTSYEGEFVNGRMHGKGRLIWPSGEVYVGWFANDRMEGFGIHYDKSGNIIYEGDWIESCPIGTNSQQGTNFRGAH